MVAEQMLADADGSYDLLEHGLIGRDGGSERVVADLALHRQPLPLGERLDVGRGAAEAASRCPTRRRPPNGATASSLTVWSLMWTSRGTRSASS